MNEASNQAFIRLCLLLFTTTFLQNYMYNKIWLIVNTVVLQFFCIVPVQSRFKPFHWRRPFASVCYICCLFHCDSALKCTKAVKLIICSPNTTLHSQTTFFYLLSQFPIQKIHLFVKAHNIACCLLYKIQ